MSDDRAQIDQSMMSRAYRLALRGVGRTSPNPPVGCVLAEAGTGQLLAEGWHARVGGPHAEAMALHRATATGRAVRGATAYVTLEPCAHFGRTPPCADALIEAGVGRCVIGRRDPNGEAAGGAERLREAGVAVEFLETPATRRLLEPFAKRVASGLPWVIVKWAQTLDGRIATRTGDSKWISNATSRAAVHRMRARVDAVMTGIGTAIADDPLLTARDAPRGRRRETPATRVVIDPNLDLPVRSRLVATAREAPVVVAAFEASVEAETGNARALEEAGVELLAVPDNTSIEGFEASVLRELARRGVTTVLVEAGGGLVGSLLRANLVDEIITYVAPRLLGDEQGKSAVRGMVIERMANALALELCRVRRFGEDIELTYRPRIAESEPRP